MNQDKKSEAPPNSQTLTINSKEFLYQTLEHLNGRAFLIQYKLKNPNIQQGDVLLVLNEDDILFHGFINRIEDGVAIARDHNSLLPPDTIQ